jgi:hypothetical protein
LEHAGHEDHQLQLAPRQVKIDLNVFSALMLN